jgi:hypothetical protein
MYVCLCMYVWMLPFQRHHVDVCESMSLTMHAMVVILYVRIYVGHGVLAFQRHHAYVCISMPLSMYVCLCMYVWMLPLQRHPVDVCESMSLTMHARAVILYVCIDVSMPLEWALLVVGLPACYLLLPALPEFRTMPNCLRVCGIEV